MSQPSLSVLEMIAEHLAVTCGDRALALEVAGRLDDRAFDVLASLDAPERAAALTLAAESLEQPEALVVFAFGNRVLPNGELAPGPVNEELAAQADAWQAATGLPVIAQWEVADAMQTTTTRVGVVERADGSVEYLSTAGVADQVFGLTDARNVVVLAMADHAVRCCRTLERVGFSAGIPTGVELPSVYDPESGQPWTRDRASYLAIDILARCVHRHRDIGRKLSKLAGTTPHSGHRARRS